MNKSSRRKPRTPPAGKPLRDDPPPGDPAFDDASAGGHATDPAASERPSSVSTVPPPPSPEAERIVALEGERDRLKDQLLRTAADFDNFRKRTRREIEDGRRLGAEEILVAMLPILDNLERAVEHAAAANEASSIADGVRLVLRQAEDILARLGVNSFSPAGDSFDPASHDAIQQLARGDVPAGTIVAVAMRGYRWADRLIRPAAVVVAVPPASAAPPPPSVAPTTPATAPADATESEHGDREKSNGGDP